ncbi:MAG: DNA repair protein RadC [Oscillospiraceae bacterium]|nr:DNA repair protein RadC [Oscillospiraceae bacterium]
MGIHDGHRERLRERYKENGLKGFNDINALELLLFYALPRKDTNPLAHELLNWFGSLQAVFSASVEELKDVPGISDSSAILIKLVPDICKLARITETSKGKGITDSSLASGFLIPRFMFEESEKVIMLSLDSAKKVKACTDISSGVVNSVDLNIRLIVETALKNKASSVILAHNHPDGDTSPSREDRETTTRIRDSLKLVDIPLVDHIIVSGNDYFSFCDAGYL